MKILVIEDEKMLADSIKEMLERKGFQLGVVGKPARDEVRLPFFTVQISISDIKAGTFVTITINGKGEATYVLITPQTSFGGDRNPRN